VQPDDDDYDFPGVPEGFVIAEEPKTKDRSRFRAGGGGMQHARLCKACLSLDPANVDNACQGCIWTLRELAKLREVIGREIPEAGKIPLYELFTRLWTQNQKLRAEALERGGRRRRR
jgi:hypothetical protein